MAFNPNMDRQAGVLQSLDMYDRYLQHARPLSAEQGLGQVRQGNGLDTSTYLFVLLDHTRRGI